MLRVALRDTKYGLAPKCTSLPPSPCKLLPIVGDRVLGASGERTHAQERAEAEPRTLISPLNARVPSTYSPH
ncbi:hypothetical protein B0H13DRAFT_2341210 [Mycena leptocephala]|nr:hypothetical protein B0H13DRAFT_2341210 [Mycena leptocephala]